MKTQHQTISLGIILTVLISSQAWGERRNSNRNHVRDTGRQDQITADKKLKKGTKAGEALNTTGANMTTEVEKALQFSIGRGNLTVKDPFGQTVQVAANCGPLEAGRINQFRTPEGVALNEAVKVPITSCKLQGDVELAKNAVFRDENKYAVPNGQRLTRGVNEVLLVCSNGKCASVGGGGGGLGAIS